MNSELERRHWLAQCAASAVTAALPSLVGAQATPPARADDLLGGGRYQEVAGGPFRYSISRVVPATGRVSLIEVPFFPHGITLDPANRQRAFVFEKIGLGAGVVDLASMRWVAPIEPVAGRRFYGHGACAPDARLLFSTETGAQGLGAIGVRDATSLKYLGDFPTYGANPHDCMLIENGQVLVITNGGGAAHNNSAETPCLCYVDVASQRLLRRVPMPDARFNTGHVAALPGRRALVVSAPRLGLDATHLGAVSRDTGAAVLQVLEAPPEVAAGMKGEALSVLELPEHDLFVVTHPTPGWLTVWRLSSGAYQRTVPLPHARGVALSADRRFLWVAYGAGAALTALDLPSLQPRPGAGMERTVLAGSHLFNHPLMP